MSLEKFIEFQLALQRASVSAPKQFLSPKDGLMPKRLIDTAKFKLNTYRENPYFFKPCGTLIFTGSQGDGKTLTAVSYDQRILQQYPKCILVTNTRIKGRPINAYVFHKTYTQKELKTMYEEVKENRKKAFFNGIIEELRQEFYKIDAPTQTEEQYILLGISSYYFNETEDFEEFKQSQEYQLRDILTDELITTQSIIDGKHNNVTVLYTGLDCLKYINNDKCGVLFFIDEIHLELNSLESKNIPVEVMVEISQQRKQRKHIVGTTQRYNRMAKPLREQVRDVVACRNFFGCIQYNQLIDGETTRESEGELKFDVKKRMLWFHSPEMYEAYDTYVKMRRYNNEWQGRPQMVNLQLQEGAT